MISDGSGLKVDILDPHWEHIHVPNMLRSMDRVNRFAGRCLPGLHLSISVLRHSLHVCTKFGPDNANGRKLGILHDGHESFTGEITTPMKRALGYARVKRIQEGLDKAIFQACSDFTPLRQNLIALGEHDTRCLIIEKEFLGIDKGDDWGTGILPEHVRYDEWKALADIIKMSHDEAYKTAIAVLAENEHG
jgi:hypothetical protein